MFCALFKRVMKCIHYTAGMLSQFDSDLIPKLQTWFNENRIKVKFGEEVKCNVIGKELKRFLEYRNEMWSLFPVIDATITERFKMVELKTLLDVCFNLYHS